MKSQMIAEAGGYRVRLLARGFAQYDVEQFVAAAYGGLVGVGGHQ